MPNSMDPMLLFFRSAQFFFVRCVGCAWHGECTLLSLDCAWFKHEMLLLAQPAGFPASEFCFVRFAEARFL